ncbi:MAG: hypothetical protein JEZ06_14580 [Anaerolineaceae bacterium]|nr:hypothetical protein [Anaerolineaceae bacterium]
MEKKSHSVKIDKNTKIFIKAHSNLELIGWEKDSIETLTDFHVQKIVRGEDFIRYVFVDNCEIYVPNDAKIVIERVSGNARVQRFEGELDIHKVSGKLALQEVRSASITRVSDNVLLQNIKGSLNIGKISGDLQGEKVAGSVLAEQVSGKVKLFDLCAGAQIRSSGDIVIGFAEGSDHDVNLRASGKINLNLPVNPDARLVVKSRGNKIIIKLGENDEEIIREKLYTYIAGLGNQNYEIDASGSVSISAKYEKDPELEILFDDLENLWKELRVESALKREQRKQSKYWEIKMVENAAKFAEEAITGVSGLAGQIAIEAIEQAEVNVSNALSEVQEKLNKLEIDVNIGNLSELFDRDENQMGSYQDGDLQESKEAVSSEERLVIMKLLQEQKITLEEADQLLDALESTSNPDNY